jgi:hypothetical protein
MEHLVPVLVVSAIVAFFMYKNINKITSNIDILEDKSYEMYAKYARIVERHIKELEGVIEKNSVLKDEKYKLSGDIKAEEVEEELSSLIRKLAFFETLQAKQKTRKELESDFFEVLSALDDIIQKSFVSGNKLADDMREKLHEEYVKLKKIYES